MEFKELIDLSMIVSLKRFTVCLTDHNELNYVPWLTRIISPASDNRGLEEIHLKVICAGDRGNNTWWHGAFDVLWQGEFKSLKRLTIFLNFESMSVPSYGENLYNHEYADKLRSQRNVAVDIISMCNPFLSSSPPVDYPMFNFQCALTLFDVIRFEQDVTWATPNNANWDGWMAVDVDSFEA